MKAGPFSLLLSVVKWDVFATLTYREAPSTEETVLRHGAEYLETIRQKLRLHRHDFYWVARIERGEKFGRLHLHLLIRVPPVKIGLFCLSAKRVPWAHEAWSRGMTSFRRIVSRQDVATNYVVKGETCGATEYELCKTGRGSSVILSQALIQRALLQQSAGIARSLSEVPVQ